jgi:hypothetical protein
MKTRKQAPADHYLKRCKYRILSRDGDGAVRIEHSTLAR